MSFERKEIFCYLDSITRIINDKSSYTLFDIIGLTKVVQELTKNI